MSPSESAPSATIAVGVALGTLTNATSQGEPMTIHGKKRDLGSRSFGRIRTCTSGAARTCFEFGTATCEWMLMHSNTWAGFLCR